MEQYIVSARKYRPSTFASVVGQQALAGTLKNAITTGRLAHAYLFCGSRGVGKTSCARIFAKTINCTNRTPQGEACNECDSCRQFNENRSMNIIELDAASNNGVDDIRELVDQVMVPPAVGRYRVFIIDEVHMLTSAAFNAFLKTLEEPPAHAIFILATTEKHKIIPTILSRCQIYDFNRISIADMIAHMQRVAKAEGIEAEPAALNVIAQKADGAMRDALSIFDQVAASTRGNITYQATIENLNVLDHTYYDRLLDAFVKQDVASALLIYKEVRSKGFDSQFFINGLGLYLRDLMVAQNPATIGLLEASDDVRAIMAQRAAGLHPTFLYKAMDLCNDADFNFRQASNKQFLIELTLIKLCQLFSPSPDESGSDGGHQLKPLRPSTDPAAQAPQTPAPAAPAAAATPAPQPAPAQQPAATPHRPAAPAPAAPKPQAYQPGHFSMNMAALRQRMGGGAPQSATTQTQAPAAESARPAMHNAFTQADFDKAWETCSKAFPGEPVLTSTLATVTPVKAAEASYTIVVQSTLQAEIVEKEIRAIENKMRGLLANDDIRFAVEVHQGELSPQYWTESKVLEAILKEHPAVGEMISKYKLRLI